MKKIFLFGLMAAGMFATSCVKDLHDNQGGEAVVSFNVATPEIATKAFSDGTTATVLQYAVYDEEGVELEALTKTDATIKGSAKVELQLTTGNTYSVIFWAAAPDAPYTVDFAKKTMTVDYTNALSNAENRDAFYKFHTFKVTGAQTETIELKRPFAQLNIGTADFAASTSAGYTPANSAVTVKSIYNTLNLWNGEVSGEAEVTYDYAAIPSGETFPVTGYEYLAMNYILVAADKALVDIEFGYTETDADAAKTRTVGSVPVQRNYRTNIYGNILTSTVDIKVDMEPEYETPDNFVQVMEGLVKNGETYEATTAAGLRKACEIAEQGALIKLAADVEDTDGILITDKKITIDLNGKTFTVSDGANTNNRNFKINGASEVTIQNGIMVAAGEYSKGAYGTVRTEGTAKVTLKKVELYNYRGNGLNVKALSGTTVNIEDSKIYSKYGGGVESAGGSIVLSGVIIKQTGMYTAPYNSMAISVNGGGTVTVESGTYSTECLTAEEANNQGTSHGPWVAGVLNSGGKLIINGGTFSNDNYGDNTLATAARGAILADTGANVQINGGTFNALKKVIDIQNNLGIASKNPTVTIAGGTFSSNPCTWDGLINVIENHSVVETNGVWTLIVGVPTATVGNTTYYNIDDAIANWTNNTTLTLIKDVTLNDVVKIKSTESHILDLGTYTMTAASGKHAIEVTCEGRSNASYALTVNADATNPGGITAKGKACIYYKKSGSTKDRPIIRIYNGVFNGSHSINSISNGNTICPQIWIYGGTFNANVNLTKNLLRVFGGTFHGWINCTGDSSAYREISGGRFKNWQFMTADADTKFWVGTSKANYNVGCYVDDEDYLVVGGAPITEFDDRFEAKVKCSVWSSYLKYSSAADGLYYTKIKNSGTDEQHPKEEDIIERNPRKK